MTVERSFDPHFLNRLANDPDIYPWICGWQLPPLDLSSAVDDRRNIWLVGEHGGILMKHHQQGLYEAHTLVAKSGRGRWALRLVHAVARWMFTHTECVEIVLRAPHGNLGALTLIRVVHALFEFTTPDSWVKDRDPIPVTTFTLTIGEWIKTAPGLAEKADWFYKRLVDEILRLNSTLVPLRFDEAHDRHIAACYEMLVSGQPEKAVVFGNRYAAMMGRAGMALLSLAPLTIDMAGVVMIFRGDGTFWVPSAS